MGFQGSVSMSRGRMGGSVSRQHPGADTEIVLGTDPELSQQSYDGMPGVASGLVRTQFPR